MTIETPGDDIERPLNVQFRVVSEEDDNETPLEETKRAHREGFLNPLDEVEVVSLERRGGETDILDASPRFGELEG